MTWTINQDGLDQPGLDCLTAGHIGVVRFEPGAFPTGPGETPWAWWCLWCGSGVSNELLPDEFRPGG